MKRHEGFVYTGAPCAKMTDASHKFLLSEKTSESTEPGSRAMRTGNLRNEKRRITVIGSRRRTRKQSTSIFFDLRDSAKIFTSVIKITFDFGVL